ncbi:MAG: competence/damage-inducible protein A [Verrucomicrobiota bacterium]
MQVEVINTGTELLLGTTVNTHLSYLGQGLFPLGLRISRQICIPDGDEIRKAMIDAFPRNDFILITGGLGPTTDDMTREITSELLQLPLEEDPAMVEHITRFYERRGRSMDETGRRQAMVPKGAEVLDNPNGTAPGLFIPRSAVHPHLFLLPGPPRELYPMFENEVVPRLQKLLPTNEALSRNWKFFGIGESELAKKLEPKLIGIGDIEIGYCAKPADVELRCIGRPELLDLVGIQVNQTFPRELISTDGKTMEETVVQLLISGKQWVSVAESCTGGLIAHRLTNVAGASGILAETHVTYSNEAKNRILGVSESDLRANGAVSEPVARSMAEGCLRISRADHALAVTGIAGPGGGSEEKPVGTVFVALASKAAPTRVERCFFPSEREAFKLRTSQQALDFLRQRLLGYD